MSGSELASRLNNAGGGGGGAGMGAAEMYYQQLKEGQKHMNQQVGNEGPTTKEVATDSTLFFKTYNSTSTNDLIRVIQTSLDPLCTYTCAFDKAYLEIQLAITTQDSKPLGNMMIQVSNSKTGDTLLIPFKVMFMGPENLFKQITLSFDTQYKLQWATSSDLAKEWHMKRFFTTKNYQEESSYDMDRSPGKKYAVDMYMEEATQKGLVNSNFLFDRTSSWFSEVNMKNLFTPFLNSTACTLYTPIPHDMFMMNSGRWMKGIDFTLQFILNTQSPEFSFTTNPWVSSIAPVLKINMDIPKVGIKLVVPYWTQNKLVRLTPTAMTDIDYLTSRSAEIGIENYLYGCEMYVFKSNFVAFDVEQSMNYMYNMKPRRGIFAVHPRPVPNGTAHFGARNHLESAVNGYQYVKVPAVDDPRAQYYSPLSTNPIDSEGMKLFSQWQSTNKKKMHLNGAFEHFMTYNSFVQWYSYCLFPFDTDYMYDKVKIYTMNASTQGVVNYRINSNMLKNDPATIDPKNTNSAGRPYSNGDVEICWYMLMDRMWSVQNQRGADGMDTPFEVGEITHYPYMMSFSNVMAQSRGVALDMDGEKAMRMAGMMHENVGIPGDQ